MLITRIRPINANFLYFREIGFAELKVRLFSEIRIKILSGSTPISFPLNKDYDGLGALLTHDKFQRSTSHDVLMLEFETL